VRHMLDMHCNKWLIQQHILKHKSRVSAFLLSILIAMLLLTSVIVITVSFCINDSDLLNLSKQPVVTKGQKGGPITSRWYCHCARNSQQTKFITVLPVSLVLPHLLIPSARRGVKKPRLSRRLAVDLLFQNLLVI